MPEQGRNAIVLISAGVGSLVFCYISNQEINIVVALKVIVGNGNTISIGAGNSGSGNCTVSFVSTVREEGELTGLRPVISGGGLPLISLV